MKKTLTVNLGGRVYHIDEDAYRLLDRYLSNLKQHFRKQQGAEEIVTDIENRIAELFAEKLSAHVEVITLADVEEVITRVGKPEDFGESVADSDKGWTASGTDQNRHTSEQTTQQARQRRLYRDPDDKVLGGVAAGVAAYFDWDVTWVRIALVALFFVPFVNIPVVLPYIIAWIVIPEALTAGEKLHMRGEAVTVENIGKTVTDGFEKVSNGVNDFIKSDKPRTALQKVLDAIIAVVSVVFKVFLVALLVVCFPALFAFAIAFVVLIVVLITLAIGGWAALVNLIPMINYAPIGTSPAIAIISTIAGLALVGIPLFGLVYAIFRQLFQWTPMSTTSKWILIILWFISLIAVVSCSAMIGWHLPSFWLHWS